MNPQKPTAVIFDWDGTIADSRARVLHCYHTASTGVLGRRFPDTPEEERALWTNNGDITLMHENPEVGQQLSASITESYLDEDGPPILMFDGLREAVRALRAAGRRIGVVTAKGRIGLKADLLRLDLADVVDAAVCGDEVAMGKPDPEGVLKALDILGVAPDRAVMVGDSPQDILAGRAAGTFTIGAAWGFFGPQDLRTMHADAITTHPGELLGTITGLLGPTQDDLAVTEPRFAECGKDQHNPDRPEPVKEFGAMSDVLRFDQFEETDPPSRTPLFDWALDVGEKVVATELPKRWTHSKAAVTKARTFTAAVGNDLDLLLAAVAVHDVGFTSTARQSGFETLDAAWYLRSFGAPDRLVNLIAHFCLGEKEAAMRGLESHYTEFGADEQSPVRDALWTCCLTTTTDGADTPARDKFDDWRVRYAHLDYTTKYLDLYEPELLAAERRTLERLPSNHR